MHTDTNRPIDEIGRVLIHLPDNATFYPGRSYLPVVIDRVGGAPRAALLQPSAQGINYMAQYEVFSALCRDRARKVVDQALLVAGRPVTPERYLGLWRTAIGQSIPPELAATHHGIQCAAVLRAPLAAMAGAKSSWTTCPFGSFAAFQAKFGERFRFDREGTFTVELDLAMPGHARAAYYAASMMCRSFDRDSAQWRVGIELRTASPQRLRTSHLEPAEA